MKDYASELLGESKQAVEPAPHNYADEMLGPKEDKFSTSVLKDIGEFKTTGSFSGLTKAGLVDDQGTKIKILAKDIFPNEQGAEERFGVVDGNIVYVGKDDKLYHATPTGPIGATKEFLANILANAPSIIGGTAGAVAGAPAGGLGSVGGAALGAAGGKGVQQIIANLLLDEPQTVSGNIKGQAKEAAWASGGAGAGVVLQKWLQRNMLRDVDKFDASKVAELDAKSARAGVDLNVAQRTNVPSLRGRAEALARIPQSADDMNVALEKTRQQAASAADDFVANVQPQTGSVRASGEAGREGATNILESIARDRSSAARPWYQKAFKASIDPRDETLQKLADTDAFKRGVERALRIAKNEGLDLDTGSGNMQFLHYVKMGIDDLLNPQVMAKEGIGATEQRAILSVKNRLLQIMDKASPDYQRARSIYGHYMPTLKAQREGILGQIADLADEDLNRASKLVFNPKNSPEDVRQLRSLFFRYDQGEKWKALTKGYLQDALENASKEFKSGAGAGKAVTWRYMMLGDMKQAANLRAAMTTDQWKGFQDMMDVFEAVGRVSGTGNSITMPMQEAAAQLRSESGSGVIGSVLKPRQKLIEWLEEARLGKHASKQVEILNDPQALKRLKELRKLHPQDKKLIQGVSTLLGISASPE